MNKKGVAFKYIVAAVLSLVILIVIIIYGHGMLSKVFGLFEERIDFVESMKDKALGDLTDKEVKDLGEKAPEVLMDKTFEAAENAYYTGDSEKALKHYEDYIAKCENPKLKESCRKGNLEEAEKMVKDLKRSVAGSSAKDELENIDKQYVGSDKLKKYEDFIGKYDGSGNEYIQILVEDAKGRLKDLKGETFDASCLDSVDCLQKEFNRINLMMQSSSANFDIIRKQLNEIVDVAGSMLREDVVAEAGYYIVKSHIRQKNCDAAGREFDKLEDYKLKKFSGTEDNIYCHAFSILMDCYGSKGMMTKDLDVKEESFEIYLDLYPLFKKECLNKAPLSEMFFLEAITFLAEPIECSKFDDSREQCHAEKTFKIGHRRITYALSEQRINDNPQLACYWDTDISDECKSCLIIEDYNNCQDYDTKEICELDPCSIRGCNWDDGSGVFNNEDCCNGAAPC